MAHQAHHMPWVSLASNFGHTKTSNGTFDIRALDKPGQPKSLIHFAKTFAKTLREYSQAERRKYDAVDEYRERAKTWVRSDRTPGSENVSDPVRRTRGVVETKKVYTDHEARLWRALRSEYRVSSGTSETQYIDNWIQGEGHWTGRENKWTIRDEWVTYWTNDWKTLMMDAALVLTPLHQRQSRRDSQETREQMDTLFLLAHHPQVPLLSWSSEGDSCCNFESGLVCLAEAVLTGYIYFNLLFAMRESGSDVCQLTDEFVPSDHEPLKKLPLHRRLRRRPRYMNTPSWSRLLYQVCRDHEHHLQVMMFEPFLHARSGENFTTQPPASTEPQPEAFSGGRWNRHQLSEVDVMTPSQDTDSKQDPLSIPGHHDALYEFLRGLWKILVNFEMLWRDQGAALHWEEMVVRQLEACFRGTEGRHWTLFWEDRQQAIEYHKSDLFVEGKVERLAEQEPQTSQYKAQKTNNKAIRREARREATLREKS